MRTYNHAYTVGFSVSKSVHPLADDVTPERLRAALLQRIEDLDKHGEWEEAVGRPFDSYEEQPEPELHDFTVIAVVDETGQTVVHHVRAIDISGAFTAVAEIDPSLSMVVALPKQQCEGKELFFPGEGLVDGETILNQAVA